jgi:hypothetical protein
VLKATPMDQSATDHTGHPAAAWPLATVSGTMRPIRVIRVIRGSKTDNTSEVGVNPLPAGGGGKTSVLDACDVLLFANYAEAPSEVVRQCGGMIERACV